jgi:hypothetical protein
MQRAIRTALLTAIRYLGLYYYKLSILLNVLVFEQNAAASEASLTFKVLVSEQHSGFQKLLYL